jgi:hypothetical protein
LFWCIKLKAIFCRRDFHILHRYAQEVEWDVYDGWQSLDARQVQGTELIHPWSNEFFEKRTDGTSIIQAVNRKSIGSSLKTIDDATLSCQSQSHRISSRDTSGIRKEGSNSSFYPILRHETASPVHLRGFLITGIIDMHSLDGSGYSAGWQDT